MFSLFTYAFRYSFWLSLLADAIPLLESAEPQFSAKETYNILQHLENELLPLVAEHKRQLAAGTRPTTPNCLNDFRIDNVEQVVQLLRLACARNLSRALIIEQSSAMAP